jgi:hypothetical protein
MDLAFRSPAVLDEPVEKVMGAQAADDRHRPAAGPAVELLDRSNALEVLAGGRPHVVLTRADVLGHLSPRPEACDDGDRATGLSG